MPRVAALVPEAGGKQHSLGVEEAQPTRTGTGHRLGPQPEDLRPDARLSGRLQAGRQ